MAGLIFRLREVSGFADNFVHGTMVCGQLNESPKGKKFSGEEEWARRKRTHSWLRSGVKFASPSEELLKADIAALQKKVAHLEKAQGEEDERDV